MGQRYVRHKSHLPGLDHAQRQARYNFFPKINSFLSGNLHRQIAIVDFDDFFTESQFRFAMAEDELDQF